MKPAYLISYSILITLICGGLIFKSCQRPAPTQTHTDTLRIHDVQTVTIYNTRIQHVPVNRYIITDTSESARREQEGIASYYRSTLWALMDSLALMEVLTAECDTTLERSATLQSGDSAQRISFSDRMHLKYTFPPANRFEFSSKADPVIFQDIYIPCSETSWWSWVAAFLGGAAATALTISLLK